VETKLTLRITLEEPPAGVDFGQQKGRGGDYETIQTHDQARRTFPSNSP